MINIKNILAENMKRFGTKNLKESEDDGAPVDKINLPNGNYIGDGSGASYDILDKQRNDTGYRVRSNKSIRGFVQDDPVRVINGVAYSDTWGEGGEYTYNDVGYLAGDGQTITINVRKQGVKLTTSLMKSAEDTKAIGIEDKIIAIHQGKTYAWKLSGIHEFSNKLQGTLQCEANMFQVDPDNNPELTASKYLQLNDADPNGYFVGIYDDGTFYIVYDSASGAKFKQVSP
jgi:hypothetical protein